MPKVINREAHPLAGSTLRLNLSVVLSVVENCFPQLLFIPVIALSSMWPPGEDASSRPGTTPVEIRIPPDVPGANEVLCKPKFGRVSICSLILSDKNELSGGYVNFPSHCRRQTTMQVWVVQLGRSILRPWVRSHTIISDAITLGLHGGC